MTLHYIGILLASWSTIKMPSNNVDEKSTKMAKQWNQRKNVYMNRKKIDKKSLSAFNDMCYVGVKIVTKQIDS